MKTIITIITAALLCGCAGSYFTFDRAAQVKIGMSESEFTKIMGKPYMTTALPESTEWIYSYATLGSVRVVKFSFDLQGKVSAIPRIPESFKGSAVNATSTATLPPRQRL